MTPVATLACLAAGPAPSVAEKQIGLVIDNAPYPTAPLAKPLSRTAPKRRPEIFARRGIARRCGFTTTGKDPGQMLVHFSITHADR